MSKYFVSIVLSALLFPALAGAQSFSGVLAKTDPALAAAFSAALKTVPAAPAPKAFPVAGETRAAYPATDYVPLHRGGVYTYEYTSSAFAGVRTLTVEYGQYSAKDFSAPVTVTAPGRSFTFRLNLTQTAVTATGSPLGGARVEMPASVTYNLAWEEGADRSRVAAVNNTVKAGGTEYRNCVRIVTRVAGGAGGTVNRYYAPGVGLVMEQVISQERQESITLLSYRQK